MKLNFVEIVLLLAASQGLFLSIIIYYKSSDLFANRLLSLVIFLFSFIIFDMFLNDIGFYVLIPSLRFLTIGIVFLPWPIFFLYVYSLTHSLVKIKKSDFWHFLPYIVGTLYFIVLFYKNCNDRQMFMSKMQHGEGMLFITIFNWIILIQIFYYLSRTIVLLVRFDKDVKLVFSNINKIQLHWLRNISFLLLVTALIFLTESLIALRGDLLVQKFNLSSIVFAASIYAIGYLALFKSTIFNLSNISIPISDIPECKDAAGTRASSNNKKYEKSEVSPDVAMKTLNNLEHIMQTERPYLNCDLTLMQLAEMLDISSHNLSQILNVYLNKNFYEYINNYRVEEVKKKLSDPKTQYLNILAIAFDSGFNSKSSFNTIFKSYVGQSPSQYRNNALK